MIDQNGAFLNPKSLLEQIKLRQGMKVGDLGCGTGFMSFIAARIVGERGFVYAVDIQKQILEQVKREARAENINNLETVWSDIEVVGATNITEGSLDVVLLVNVLFQISDKKGILSEARRLLKSGGVCLVVDWKPGTTSIGPPSEKRVNFESLNSMATTIGFVVAGQIDAGTHHQGVVYKI